MCICLLGSVWLVVDYWKTQAQILDSVRLLAANANHGPIDIWTSDTFPGNTDSNSNSSAKQATTAVNDVYLVKVRKAASTTLQMILNRYAAKKKLKVASFNAGYGVPYPKVASKLLLYEDIQQTNFKPYNIMHEQAIYDEITIAEYMKPGHKLIGSLREPLAHFRAYLRYLDVIKKFGFDRNGDVAAQFLDNPKKFKRKTYYDTIRNCQAQHYGYELFPDHTNSSRFIKYIDERFDLVLIAEKFDESLLLMKRMFRWSLADIVYISRHVSEQESKPIVLPATDEKLYERHRQFSPVDHLMYDYFATKLNQLLANQTQDFWIELKEFRSIREKFDTFCDSMCDVAKELGQMNVSQSRYLLHSTVFQAPVSASPGRDVILTYADCVMLSMSTLSWHIAIKIRQFPQLFCSTKTRSISEKQSFYDPVANEIREDQQGKSRRVTPELCNERHFVAEYFSGRTVFLDLFTKQSSSEQPFCIKTG